jgi:outer membrane receptor protein involved in Fe transport
MNTSLRTKLLPVAIAGLLAASPVFAQDTSSSISGRVLDAGGQPVAGATVQIVHEPSGTTKTTTTDASGRYSAQGLRVGGPFDVTVSKDGSKVEQENVYLQLATDTAINLTIGAGQAAVQNLGGVTVSANTLAQTFNSDNKGLSTNLSRRELEATPTPNRSIQDVVRLDPRVTITDRDRGQISALGQNFRYNNITIDTVSAGDPFGLEDNGLASVGTPISQDTIEEYNISTANYDVSARRGVGANVNAVTKSGTNNFHGSVYYTYQNTNDMVGELKNANGQSSKYNGFDRNWTSGFTFGGPILKDKLFFFASYEESKKVGVGSSYGPTDSDYTNTVQGLTQAQVDSIISQAQKLGLTPGNYTDKFDLTDKRYLVKLDWNISSNHRASFRFNQTKEVQPIATASAVGYLNLSSNWYSKNRDSKSYTLNFFDDWTDKFSTESAISYATYDQARAALVGGDQPYIQIYPNNDATGGTNVALGTEPSSQVNALSVKSWNAYFAGTVYLGDHTLKGGVDYERDQYYNAFLQRYFGSYQFNLANWPSGAWYNYQMKRPVNGYSLDDVAARYTLNQYGIFLQDTWQVTDRLSLQYGVRVDIPITDDQPLLNPCFAAAPGKAFTAYQADGKTPACVASKGGFGYANNTRVSGNRVVEPRLSFNYQFDTERMTQLRGGAGLFIANNPSVWLSNAYANNGYSVGTWNITDSKSSLPGTVLANVGAKPAPSYDPNNPIIPGNSTTLGSSSAKMAVDTVDPNFKQPTVWKMNLALDRELPWMGIVGSVEWIHLQVRDAIFYKNINIGAPTGVSQDGRNLYWNANVKGTGGTASANGLSSSNERANQNPAFDRATTLLTNSHKGSSDNLTLSFKKAFSNEWFGMVGFTWNRATDVNPGSSSVANSNYNNNVWVNPNDDKATTSAYSVPYRVIASLSWQHRFFGDYATTMSAMYDGHSGSPYSWTFGNDINGDGYARDLVYIPKSVDDVKWASAVTSQMKQQFMDYINNDDYLRKHKGEIAGRNADRAAWISQLDLSFRQEIPGLFDGNKGIISLDIYNFTNMLNKRWGVERRATFPGVRNLADVSGIDANGNYYYDISGKNYKDKNGNYAPNASPLPVNESLNPSQRWSAMLSVKYTF